MKKRPIQHDDIEKAMRLLARAAERMQPHGQLILSMQWVPGRPAKKRGKGEGEKHGEA